LLDEWKPERRLWRSIKCELIEGSFRGSPAVAKVLVHEDPIWRWYFDRELAILRGFAIDSPPVRAPTLLAADGDTMILERFGEPLGGRTYDPKLAHALSDPKGHGQRQGHAQDQILEMLAELEAWTPKLSLPMEPPPEDPLRRMRERLLEDPTGDWVREGIDRSLELRIIDASQRDRMIEALRDHPVRAQHGDLLARNILDDAIVDWECAGLHPAGWDRALLWTSAPSLRDELAKDEPAFWALAMFAVCREIKFAQRGPAKRRAALTATLRDADENLREALRTSI
jgi:hypothetical protein